MDPYGGATSSTAGSDLPGRIRKRRYSTARIQPVSFFILLDGGIMLISCFQTRIKKVMQSDEEIGRMIASVPVAGLFTLKFECLRFNHLYFSWICYGTFY